ncbi:coniferyl aldehyde dehydrogenase [Luteimonas sp. XNQY3]|nr:coniferyl aldehyde dehydrogenase [Luteimonas sp. XNQY3]MCD9006832.1 coniferyl aldehyde dehydrogenase [Luteimonas sp. XNQY3]
MDAAPHDPTSAATPVADLQPTLDALRAAWRDRRPDAAQRRDDLARLRAAFARRLTEMADAISADFGHRARAESLIADGMTVLSEIDALRGYLRGWMRPRRVGAGWKLWPARAEVRPVPLGVVGVIAPWNYPVNLALIPLATAIAAGNHVYLKPSEHTPRSSAFLRSLLAEVFPADRVAVALGDADIGAAFAGLPFDHLVFTGSTAVGRKVMAAAVPNLTPLTLELGGKSPAIVCPGYPLDKAAARLVTGKLFNAGQTCIAPDYVLVDAARRDALLEALRFEVQARYADAGARASDYTHIVSDAQHARLTGLLDDARARGLAVLPLLEVEGARALAPTLVVEPGDDTDVMREEIFGPILPVLSYTTLDEAIAFVEARDRPLALYPFGDRTQAEAILARTVAGGVTVNDTLLHFAANRLPFGGVGPSGMGAYHGRAGFDAMTKALPVLWQSRFAVTDWLRPPYARIAKFVDWLAR